MAPPKERKVDRETRLAINKSFGLQIRVGDLLPVRMFIPIECYGGEETTWEVAVQMKGSVAVLRIRMDQVPDTNIVCMNLGHDDQAWFDCMTIPSPKDVIVTAQGAEKAFRFDRAARKVQRAWRSRAFAREKRELVTKVDDHMFDSDDQGAHLLPWEIIERILFFRLRDRLTERFAEKKA